MFARRVLPRTQQPFRCLASSYHIRPFSTTELSNGVTLAYDLHEPPKKTGKTGSQDAPAILFIHGLFGSKKNNRSMSKYALYNAVRLPRNSC